MANIIKADNGVSSGVTQELLAEYFEYKDGYLYRIKLTKNDKKNAIGDRVGYLRSDGYWAVNFMGKAYKVHRLIFLLVNGFMPDEIDHINNDKSDNSIENLRPANRQQNMCNKKAYKTNTSGAKGVVWMKNLNKWLVNIGINGKRKYIGIFEDFELAELASIEARNKYHGNFANHLIKA